MSKSISELAGNLATSELHHTRAAFPDERQFGLVQQKGIYPYNYIDDLAKFRETQLPPPEAFYNTLYEKEITDDEYQHVLNVWDTFGCMDLEAYHDIYLKTDILLLCDIFEKFRMCADDYGLDPAHYVGSPGLSSDAMMKRTGVQLELFTDEMMYTFMEAGLRDGVSMIVKRYAKANNRYIPNFNPDDPESYLI